MYFLGEQCTAGVIHSQTSYPQLTALQSGRAAAALVPGSADSLRVCTCSTDSLSLCLKSIGHFYRKQPLGKGLPTTFIPTTVQSSATDHFQAHSILLPGEAR